MMKRNNRSDKMVAYYESTYHGKVQELGYPAPVAGCADCHTKHNILPKDDPRSSINPANLEAELRALSLRFPTPVPELQGPPGLPGPATSTPPCIGPSCSCRRFSSGRLPSSGVHTVLWWRKVYWEHDRHGQEGIVPPSVSATGEGLQQIQRFSVQVTDHARAADALILHARADRVPR